MLRYNTKRKPDIRHISRTTNQLWLARLNSAICTPMFCFKIVTDASNVRVQT